MCTTDAEYFKAQIEDELCGSKDYIKRAIELKPMDVQWSKVFVEMSAAELDHATNLYKLFMDYYEILSKKYSEMPAYIDEIKSDIIDMYSEKSMLIKNMHEMYKK